MSELLLRAEAYASTLGEKCHLVKTKIRTNLYREMRSFHPKFTKLRMWVGLCSCSDSLGELNGRPSDPESVTALRETLERDKRAKGSEGREDRLFRSPSHIKPWIKTSFLSGRL